MGRFNENGGGSSWLRYAICMPHVTVGELELIWYNSVWDLGAKEQAGGGVGTGVGVDRD